MRHYPKQGPWARKSGSATGSRDGYVITIGTMRDRQGMKIAILLRLKKTEQTEAVKPALESAGMKKATIRTGSPSVSALLSWVGLLGAWRPMR